MNEELAGKWVGRSVMVEELSRAGNRMTPATVSQVRAKFGRVDLEIQPTGGTGSEWVSEARVKLVESGGRDDRAVLLAALQDLRSSIESYRAGDYSPLELSESEKRAQEAIDQAESGVAK